jgi:hypothetical protein
MSTQEPNDVFDFESLFEEKKPEEKVKPLFPLNRAIISVVVYFFIMLFVAGFAVLSFYEMDDFTKDYTVQESMIYNVYQNPNAVGYLSSVDYYMYESDYPNLVILYEDLAFVVFANGANPYLKTSYTIEQIRTLYTIENLTWNTNRPTVKVELLMFEYNQDYLDHMGIIELTNAANVKTPKAFTELTDSASSILNFAIYIVLAVSIIPITFSMMKVEIDYFKKPFKQIGVDAVVGYGIMLIASIGAQFAVQIIGFIFNYAQPVSLNQQAIERSLLSSTGVLMILVTILFAPILEELIFRKAMFRFFKNQWVAMVVSSLIFGLIHVSSERTFLDFFTNLITYSASGFALGYVYIKNKHNVWSSILVHAVANAVSIIMILFLAFL